MSNEILKKAETYVSKLFVESNVKNLVYHNINHTRDVVKAVEKIGKGSNLTEPDLELVLLSAWFHDVGYILSRENHEEKSVEIAENFLTENNNSPEKINNIKSIISATKYHSSPKSLNEKIIRDADMYHLSKKKFLKYSKWLKLERELIDKKEITEREWAEETLTFITNHKYYTAFANKKYELKKYDNLIKLKERIKELKLNELKGKIKKDKLALQREKIIEKEKSSGKSDRGIETMFRNVIRTHVEFSGMADNKANIMISVNTLVLTAIIAILARKLDSNPHLIIPTIVLTIVSLSTLIVATFVTRPKITDGVFTEDDINKKRTNLLFFGNFYKMKLDKFTWGMKEMMKDKDFLYGNMIMDFYYLGQVLGKKYKYLNICYGIFIYGLIVSVIVFAIAIFYVQEPTNLGSMIE